MKEGEKQWGWTLFEASVAVPAATGDGEEKAGRKIALVAFAGPSSLLLPSLASPDFPKAKVHVDREVTDYIATTHRGHRRQQAAATNGVEPSRRRRGELERGGGQDQGRARNVASATGIDEGDDGDA